MKWPHLQAQKLTDISEPQGQPHPFQGQTPVCFCSSDKALTLFLCAAANFSAGLLNQRLQELSADAQVRVYPAQVVDDQIHGICFE